MANKLSLHGQQFPYLDYSVKEHGRDLTFTWGPKGIRWDTGLGQAYLTSDGFDATDPDKLRLAPQYFSLNRTSFTAKPGFFYEVGTPQAGVTIDTTNKTKTKGTGALSVSFTTGTGSNRLMMVLISVETLAQSDIDTLPAYGGVSLDHRESSTTGTLGWIMYYLTAPASGTANVTWANPNSRNAIMHVIGFSNVLQIDPFGNVAEATGTSTTPSVTANIAAPWTVIDIMVVANTSSIAVGANQTSQSTDTQGSTGSGVSTQNGTDGGVMSWTVTSGAWKIGAVGILPAQSQAQMLVADSEYTHKFSFDGTTISSVTAAVQNPSAEYTGWQVWDGLVYLLGGVSVFAQKVTPGLTTDTYTNTDWYGVAGTQFQDAAVPELAIAVYDGTHYNRIGTAALTGLTLTLADFSSHGNIGDAVLITGLVEASAFMGVAKADGLWEIDADGVGRTIVRVPFDYYNGFGTTVFGDIVFYPVSSGLWLYYIGRDVAQQGVEVLQLPRIVNTGLTAITLQDRRPWTPIIANNWIYWSQANATKGAVIASRLRKSSDPPGKSDLIQHMLWDLDAWSGGIFSTNKQLWMKGATYTGSSRYVRIMQLSADGSPGAATNRGTASTAHRIALLDGDGNILCPVPGRLVQLRHAEVRTSNGFGATTSLQLSVYRDSQNSADNVGSAVTSDGMTNNLTMTVGTTDTAERWIPVVTLTTNGSYVPSTQDPWIHEVTYVFRRPQVIQIIIPASDDVLLAESEAQLNYNNARKLLQGYLSQGPGTMEPPAQLVSDQYLGVSYTGEVVSVKEDRLQGKPVFVVEVVRWTTD